MGSFNQDAVKNRYGRTPSGDDVAIGYLKAVKIIIGADGESAEGEQKAFDKGMNRLGISDAIRKDINDFDFKSGKLEEVLPDIKQGGLRARMLIRDAVEISRADGVYADEEKAAVAKAAELLGVSNQTLRSIEALVELEHAASHLRKALFPKPKS